MSPYYSESLGTWLHELVLRSYISEYPFLGVGGGAMPNKGVVNADTCADEVLAAEPETSGTAGKAGAPSKPGL